MTLDGPRLPPASGAAPEQIVLLLHGYGSNGADLLSLAPLWQSALPDALFVAPNAPERCPGAPGGYQWWDLRTLSREAVALGAASATPVLDAYIDTLLAENGLADDRLLIVGFSQGTIMALQVGLRHERPVAGILGYSGALADPAGLPDAVRSKPPVLLIHGTLDSVVPLSACHEASAALRQIGISVEERLIPGLDHGIDDAGIRAGGEFARTVLRLA